MTHTMEMLGKTKVKVKDEKVVEAGEPMIKYCPLFDKVRGIKEVTSEAAADNMKFRMENYGMCSRQRKLEMGIFVGFGASESMMTGIIRGIIDGAVTVCDGAGTVITANPQLVQGMGGYMSGLSETEPIPEVIEGIEKRSGHVLSPKDAGINQLEGAMWAASNGFSSFAVTVADAKTAEKLRGLENEAGVRIMIIGVHLTGITPEDARRILAAADIVTGCASKHIREQVKPLVQVGTAVPLFGLTQWGKELLVERAKDVELPLLINTMQLPVLPEHKQPRPLA
ncbi:MAG TPA: methanogenesis marker 8 protein [Methanothrix sp.]|nr:methanogenesis marker 8 protein [Methanothrix sp.]